MGRGIQRLSARGVSAATARGYYADGGGLYLQVSAAGARSWVFRYQLAKRAREMGLGSINAVTLSAARTKAAECRALLADRIDPISFRKKSEDCPTFKIAAIEYIEANRKAWKNEKHGDQWTNTLTTYAFPFIGDMLIRDIQTADILKILNPIWADKTETATRVRGRVETIIDSAKVNGHRDTENPARWKGHLEMILPKPSKVATVEHHKAMPYADLPEFMAALQKRKGIAVKCLEFTILTCVRTREATGCVPAELDLANDLWVIPKERMKANKRHAVPLAPRAREILESIPRIGEFIFPNPSAQELSENAMLGALNRAGAGDYTVHGFRSTFRDWAADKTNYPNEVVEMALAHVVADKTEAAYRRGELLDKRRALAADWEAYCLSAIKPT